MSYIKNLEFVIKPGGHLQGQVTVPGDKSISHRAVMLGAIADGETRVDGFLPGEDTLATMNAFRLMGVEIEYTGDKQLIITGIGKYGLSAPEQALDLGNSGTSARLLCGLLAGQKFDTVLVGDDSLMTRPMLRIMEPLKAMRADIECSPDGTLPITIHGGQTLSGIDYVLPVASAQVKSCLLLAGLYARGETCLHENHPTRDHTERMLQQFGYELYIDEKGLRLTGGGKLAATAITIPSDISSAAFLMVGACIAKGSELTLLQVGINPTRSAVIDILQMMGANIELLNKRDLCGEPVADLHIRSSQLHGIEIPADMVPVAIDEFPAIMVAAAVAEGETILKGATELRVKESDRILSVVNGLRAAGIEVEELADGMIVTGGRFQGGIIDSFGDHRIAMAFAMAGLVAQEEIRIKNCKNVNTSFPGFTELCNTAGLHIQEQIIDE